MSKNMPHSSIRKLILSAMFITLSIVLPFLTGQIPYIGRMLLPMHIPVFLCGLVCGWKYGLVIGIIVPVFRALIFGMPPIYPTAIAMAFELGTYGLVSGIIYFYKEYRCVKTLMRAILWAMLCGRVVWAFAMIVLLGINGSTFTWQAFIAGAFLNAVPGIILQLLLIPAIMVALDKTKTIPFGSHETANHPNN